jgi:nicotinic acid mononucleotide adenylyltransferase
MDMSSESFDQQLTRLRRAESPTLLVTGEPTPRPKSIALLSGSFDPMTVAHAALADGASRLVDLVLLVYSARTLPKEESAPPSLLRETDRLEALERFRQRHAKTAVAISSHGLLAEQVEAARERFPTQGLFMVVGSDKVLQMLDPKWYEDRDRTLEGLFREAVVLYADRAGEESAVEAALKRPENAPWADRFKRLNVPARVAAVSSTSVRTLIEAGKNPSDLVVEEFRPYLPKR